MPIGIHPSQLAQGNQQLLHPAFGGASGYGLGGVPPQGLLGAAGGIPLGVAGGLQGFGGAGYPGGLQGGIGQLGGGGFPGGGPGYGGIPGQGFPPLGPGNNGANLDQVARVVQWSRIFQIDINSFFCFVFQAVY